MRKYKPDELPELIEKPVTIFYNVSGYEAGEIGAFCFDWGGDADRVVLHKTTATFAIPPQNDLKGKVLHNLEEERNKILAESHIKLKAIDDKIQMLLAIEYKPENIEE